VSDGSRCYRCISLDHSAAFTSLHLKVFCLATDEVKALFPPHDVRLFLKCVEQMVTVSVKNSFISVL